MIARRFLTCVVAFALFAGPNSAIAASPLQTRLEMLSNGGNGEAAYHLGMLYHVGLGGVRKDARKAFQLFQLSAGRGDPLGAYKLGCYYDGQGEGIVEFDPKIGLKYKMIAAEAGYALAQHDVGLRLLKEDKLGEAMPWLEAAATQGDNGSLMVLSALYSGDLPAEIPQPPKDLVKSQAFALLATRGMEGLESAAKAEARKRLSADEHKRALSLVAAWREKRSPITEKADKGIAAAYITAGLRVPKS